MEDQTPDPAVGHQTLANHIVSVLPPSRINLGSNEHLPLVPLCNPYLINRLLR
jgi:hypothetical protein